MGVRTAKMDVILGGWSMGSSGHISMQKVRCLLSLNKTLKLQSICLARYAFPLKLLCYVMLCFKFCNLASLIALEGVELQPPSLPEADLIKWHFKPPGKSDSVS